MGRPPKRPLKDPSQYYAYVWKHLGEVIWVGFGHNNRGRPQKSNNGGRPLDLVKLLTRCAEKIEWEVYPCDSKEDAMDLEVHLTKSLHPKYNVAIGFAGFAGHSHTQESRTIISAKGKGRPVSDLCRQKSRERAIERNRTNPPRKGKVCSEEHKRKLSEAAKRRKRG